MYSARDQTRVLEVGDMYSNNRTIEYHYMVKTRKEPFIRKEHEGKAYVVELPELVTGNGDFSLPNLSKEPL